MRECLALKVDRSITSEDVIDMLAELFGMRGVPTCVRSDNGNFTTSGNGKSLETQWSEFNLTHVTAKRLGVRSLQLHHSDLSL